MVLFQWRAYPVAGGKPVVVDSDDAKRMVDGNGSLFRV